jgi:hypothetical protein
MIRRGVETSWRSPSAVDALNGRMHIEKVLGNRWGAGGFGGCGWNRPSRSGPLLRTSERSRASSCPGATKHSNGTKDVVTAPNSAWA